MAGTTVGGLRKQSMAFTPEQWAWLEARSASMGRVPVAVVVRQLVQAAMDAEQTPKAKAS